MDAVVGTVTAVVLLAGVIFVRSALRSRRRRLRGRADGERLGVRISNAIEQIRRGR